jgi:hypothetical protein
MKASKPFTSLILVLVLILILVMNCLSLRTGQRAVLKLEIGNSEGKVDVSGLENGIYFVEVHANKYNFIEKILIFY